MSPKPITWITNNFVRNTLSRKFYFTGTKWKPYIDEHRKYTRYTFVYPMQIPNGSYWEPINTKIKGGIQLELLSKDPGIAFDIEYDENHIQLPAVDLQTDGVPTHTALHNLGGYTGEFTETRWDATNRNTHSSIISWQSQERH